MQYRPSPVSEPMAALLRGCSEFDPTRTEASVSRSCTRNRPKSDDECFSAIVVSTSLEADIAAARTFQKAGEFDSRHATSLEGKKLELSAGAPPRSLSTNEERVSFPIPTGSGRTLFPFLVH
ncbi:hypothetical protein CORC01_07298 [Colletotrichum orchidophilum]|uniref:Uncharacterized protein n=1 Tax=Colletotrichum orchidophilum TaxID=1209926 RepID=A0A1G4B7W5_9PEZI|nr:uncharacterized protein CORC01_07298 [Colletotrichum orchidophilum]OHE97393.1 hypothetical protein CORC01_07298 [Colletotrichum orchidophilum]